MAITQVGAYAHLSPTDIDELGRELDAIRADITDSLGAKDAAYIRHTIAAQRALDVVSRALTVFGRSRTAVVLGTAGTALAKIIENMELGHNIGHGQWDWMNDPEIHSATWEWDMMGASEHWRYSHNYQHHVYTNVIDHDEDLGFGVMRVTRDQEWRPAHLLAPLQNLLLALTFEWGIALHGLYAELDRSISKGERSGHLAAMRAKMLRQLGKDYLVLPLLSGRRWKRTLAANVTANVVRNVWAYLVIFCGHFPDGAEKFDPSVTERESRAEWYLRQMLGTANFDAGRTLAFLSGNLCYQIEHHLFPELPSNRYAEIAVRVRAVCERYDLPYTSGPLLAQYLLTLRTIHKLSLPDRFLTADCHDAPETASEQKFAHAPLPPVRIPGRPHTGLRTALHRLAARG
ncbi:fatty acid desaturase family protein [Nocardia harenae]|uniref:fatty acid desaturase family protein n=1 Tax=Nocardia harenae TaxID=358707 RepID=UPI0008301E65|nr:acyl-CoA desaturase [Nocardia harenae]